MHHPTLPSTDSQSPSLLRLARLFSLAASASATVLSVMGQGLPPGQSFPSESRLSAPQPPAPAIEESDLVLRAPWNGEPLGTGSRRPTPEQWAWGESNLQRLEHIPMTPLGLERLNAHRWIHGKPAVDALFFDSETASSRDGTDAAAPAGATTAGTGALPTGIDNSTLKFFPPIRSQGSLNSCAQFSAVYYTLTHMTAMARNWDAKSGGDAYRFSPKWTYNMVNGGQNVGSWHYDAYAIAQKHGAATWAEFPYDANYRAWCLNPDAWWNAIQVRADQAGKVADIDASTGLDQLKQFLVNGYVLNFATYINSWVWGTAANDPNTPADDAVAGKPCVKQVNGTSGGHSMTIVGYNDDLWLDLNANGVVDAGEKGALRIANSWGTSWNEAGFCWIAYQALRTRNPAVTSEGLAWYDEATWVTARSSYSPRLVAQFNVTHAKRSQLAMSLGTADTSQTTPAANWSPTRVLSVAGGAYAFDGNTTPVPATFYLDFTDLAPSSPGARRFFLGMRDSTAGDSATLSSYALMDVVNGQTLPATAVPATADGTQSYIYVDYDALTGAVPPVAYATATSASGSIPLDITFDSNGSYDPDGTLTTVAWDFGDGTAASGPTARHTFTRAGTFTVTVTVTDNEGAQDTANLSILAVDPTIIATPSALAASASSRTVTLRWTDNSNNESGFQIERGLKGRTGISYAAIATVAANVQSHSETVSANTYYYRVRAVNTSTGRTSAYSNAVSIRVR